MTPSEAVAARKSAQETEATQRGIPRPDSDLDAAALQPDVDGETGDARIADGPALQPSDTPADDDLQPERVFRSPKDDIRSEIAKNFRTRRDKNDAEAQEDARELQSLAGMPPEFQDLVVEDTQAAPLQQQQDQPAPQGEPQEPARRKVKIRGEERWLTDDELLAAAQKGLAGDDYLGEARATLEATKALKSELEAMRAAPAGKHPAGDGAQPGEIDGQPGDGEHPASDPYKDLIEKLQYGDPNEAANDLRKLVATAVPALSKEEIIRQRLADEHTRSMQTLKGFQDTNPDLANDHMATAAIRAKLFELQRDDLVKAGFDLSSLNANDPRSPDLIANAHLRARASGASVRGVGDLLNEAKAEFVKWRPAEAGKDLPQVPAPPLQPQQRQGQPAQQPSRQAGQRVEVNVDRTARRQAIQQQPTRTVAPRPDAQPQAPRDRKSVVDTMRAARLRARGASVAI